jgi:acetyl/propionyl-CoA carboxylase alpha subunit
MQNCILLGELTPNPIPKRVYRIYYIFHMKCTVKTRNQKNTFDIPKIASLRSDFEIKKEKGFSNVRILETWPGGSLRLVMINGKVLSVAIRKKGNGFPDFIDINGTRYSVDVSKIDSSHYGGADTKSAKQASGKITAVLPGQISSLQASLGQEVKRGQLLGILEAMKMENEIRAPRDGKILAVNVKQGQTVMRNDLILEIA